MFDSVFLFRPDTIWGFSCKYTDKESIKKIIQLKKRDENKPFIVLASSFKDVESIAHIEQEIKEVIGFLSPGNLFTLLIGCERCLIDLFKVRCT